jgi:hypothetical protein
MTSPTDDPSAFAVAVLGNLLHRVDAENHGDGRHAFLVSHAWTDGPTIYVIYAAPPSDIAWGLVRDTRSSVVDGEPWTDVHEAGLYYYLLDLAENWPGNFSRQAGEPDEIRWMGDLYEDLPVTTADLVESTRYVCEVRDPSETHHARETVVEPRRYVDPR